MKRSIGIDIVNVNRIENIYSKYGDKFLNRICNPREIKYIQSKNYNVQTIAGIFSAKESIAKALGTGISDGLSFKDIQIIHNTNGAPRGMAKDIDFSLSISHDNDLAISIAMKNGLHIEEGLVLLSRSDKTFKGSFGRLMVMASSKGMVGSGYLSSMAALRCGTGLVYHYVDPKDGILDILSIKYTEVIVRDNDPLTDVQEMDAIAIGPGLGKSNYKKRVLKDLLNIDIPMVIDADGINLLTKEDLKDKTASTILTPHIGEFRRLTGKDLDNDGLRECGKKFAKKYETVLVLKDYKTLVTDGDRHYILDEPNGALATAGSGDVLTGIIGALVAQGHSLYDSGILGVQIHSLAGKVSKYKNSSRATIATDLIESLKEVFVRMESVDED